MNRSFSARRLAPASLVASLAFVVLPAAAQDTPTVIVTGSVLPRTVGTELAASSVLTRGDLERAGVRDLVAALGLLGTSVPEQLGGPGTQTALRLRGADTRDTLVLIDGVPITDVTSGQASIASISVDDIERIEVVRGNLSALHGGNATGGVVQVFTRRGRPGLSGTAHLGLGSRGTSAAGFGVTGGNGTATLRLTAGGERGDGFSAMDAPTANPDRDGYRRRFATLATDIAAAPGQHVSLDLRWLKGRVEYDSGTAWDAPTDTHEAEIEQKGLTLRGRHAVSPAWSLAWHLGGNDEERLDTVDAAAFGAYGFGNRLHNRSAMAEATGTLTGTLALKLAAERLRQWTDNDTYLQRRRTTDTLRVGLQDERAWGGWQVAWRRDDSSDFGAATAWLAGGRLILTPVWSALATVSTSYTPPTLDFLYFDCSPFPACSNPNLKPERAHTVEAGLQWQHDTSRLRATLFAARYRDKIASDADFVPQNLARTRNRGVEVVGETSWVGWRVTGELLLQQPENADTGERLLRRAREQASLRVGRDVGALALEASMRHVGDRRDGADGSIHLPSSTVVGLHAAWRFAPGWALATTLDNLFDADEVPAAGYNGRPRSLFVQLTWQP